MSVEVVELKNPAAFDLPEIRDLFDRAFKDDKPVPVDIAIEELRDLLSYPKLGILVGQENGEFRALAILMERDTRLFNGATVYHFFSDGSAALTRELVSASREWAKARGYDTYWILNASGRSDAAWKRKFASAGPATKVGTVFEIDISGVAS